MYINVDGKLINNEAIISPISQSVMYGYGVFETILIKNSKPVFLNEHIDRLFSAFKELNIKNNKNKHFYKNNLYKTINYNKINEGIVKLTIIKENDDKNISIISTESGSKYSEDNYRYGFKLITINNYRNNPYSKLTYIKSCNYLSNILARKEVKLKGGDEGLILNIFGNVAEGTVSNIFMIDNERIYTPPLNVGLFPGIIRGVLLEEIKKMGYYIFEKVITLNELKNADEVFITNSLMGVMPVVKIDNNLISSGKPEKITYDIKKHYYYLLQK